MIYETEEDRNRELSVLEEIKTLLKIDFTQSKPLSPYDFIASLGGVTVFLFDIKCRNTSSTDFDTVFASKEKYDFALGFHKNHGTPVFLFVKFKDCIKLFNLWSPDKLGGSVYRKDRDETRPVVEFFVKNGKTLTY